MNYLLLSATLLALAGQLLGQACTPRTAVAAFNASRVTTPTATLSANPDPTNLITL